MIRLAVILLISLVMICPVVNAEEKPMNLISCRSGDVNMLTVSKELVVYGYEFKGIDLGTEEDKTFENFTHKCIGVTRVMGGPPITTAYCKYMDPDGDYFIVIGEGEMGQKGLPWEFLQGTGKWEGIKGGGIVYNITKGKAIEEGTHQYCIKVEGKYELLK